MTKIKSILNTTSYNLLENNLINCTVIFDDYPVTKTPQQLKIEELENTINEAQKQLQELKGL